MGKLYFFVIHQFKMNKQVNNIIHNKKRNPHQNRFFRTRNTGLTAIVLFRLILLTTGIIFLGISQQGCGIYSFTGASIDPNVKTFSVATFENIAGIVSPGLANELTEKLKDKCSNEARLDLVTGTDGDVTFEGTILSYNVEPAASGANDRAAQNKLLMAVRIEYKNHITDDDWTVTIQHSENFDANANLTDAGIESTLNGLLVDKFVNEIFTRAFSNW